MDNEFDRFDEAACYYEDEATGNCKECGQEELSGNLKANDGLCNDCYEFNNPY